MWRISVGVTDWMMWHWISCVVSKNKTLKEYWISSEMLVKHENNSFGGFALVVNQISFNLT